MCEPPNEVPKTPLPNKVPRSLPSPMLSADEASWAALEAAAASVPDDLLYNKGRKNARRPESESCYSLTLGVQPWQWPLQATADCEQRPEVARVRELLDKLVHAWDPNFSYHSIQLNKNFQTKKHRDWNNDGMSCIAGFGSYTGGELLLHPDDQPTRRLDVRHRFQVFDGNTLHSTAKYVGERYSAVFFSGGRYDGVWQTAKDKVAREVAKATAAEREAAERAAALEADKKTQPRISDFLTPQKKRPRAELAVVTDSKKKRHLKKKRTSPPGQDIREYFNLGP